MKIVQCRWSLVVGLLFLRPLLVLVVLSLLYLGYTYQANQPTPTNEDQVQQLETGEENSKVPPFEPLAAQEIATAVELALADLAGEYSLVVYDPIYQQVIVEVEPDKQYFSASLYKLYLAFLVWQDVDQSVLALDQIILNHPVYGNRNLWQCLDIMVRISDSPCAEALLATYSYQELQSRLNDLGLVDIDVENFLVSARDMAKLIELIEAGQSLSAMANQHLLASMNLQIYRQGLQQVFSKSGSLVYNKVGYSPRDWHDVGLVRLGGEGRPLVIALLTNQAGVARVAEAADTLNQLLTTEPLSQP